MVTNSHHCSGIPNDCAKCPTPFTMTEQQLHDAILKGQNKNCVQTASLVYARKITSTLKK